MKNKVGKLIFILVLITFGLAWNGEIKPTSFNNPFSSAEAVIGRPGTPVSYAGVARRTPVGGVNTRYNRGGPVNRVGRR